jgi:hypothetical protein
VATASLKSALAAALKANLKNQKQVEAYCASGVSNQAFESASE